MLDPNTPVYLINLDRSPRRLKHMQKHYHWENFIRFPAIDGRQWTRKKYLRRKAPSARLKWIPRERQRMVDEKIIDPVCRLGPNQVACALSHAAIWKEQVEKNLPMVIIMEDDTQPSKHYTDKLTNLISMPPDTDVLMLHDTSELDDEMGILDGYGLFGYVLTLNAAKNALLAQFPILDPVDIQWWHRSFHKMDAPYYPFPAIERVKARRHDPPLVEYSIMYKFSAIGEKCDCTYCVLWEEKQRLLKEK